MKLFIFFVLSIFSSQAFSAEYCQASSDVYHIQLPPDLEVLPGLSIGSEISTSGEIPLEIKCTKSYTYALLQYKDNPQSGVEVNIGGRGLCGAMDSGYPGLGIVWYNYNYNTNKWQCNSGKLDPNNIDDKRRGLASGTTKIVDVIFLVKTGEISTGNFEFNEEFVINEGYGTPTQNMGELYRIVLSGSKNIEAPLCEIRKSNFHYLFDFGMADVINSDAYSDVISFDLICSGGFIENGTQVPVRVQSAYGVFSLDSRYFATTVEGLGISFQYKVQNNSDYQTLYPDGTIMTPVNDNSSTIRVKLSPFIKQDSGVYPLSNSSKFGFKLYVDR